MRRIGLICAMQREHDCLSLSSAAGWDILQTAPFPTSLARIGDSEAVCVVGGIGKSAAAASTQYLFERYRPLIIISFGLAGALDETTRPGDIVFPALVLQGDTGIYDRGGFQPPLNWVESESRRRLHHEYAADPELHAWGREFFRGRGVGFQTGPLVTCDQAVFSSHRRRELSRAFGAIAVDMESGAVAQVAALNRVPFVVVRAVSDAHDLEMEDCGRLVMLQADSTLTKVKGVVGALRQPRHWKFLKDMQAGSGHAYDRLGSLLPAFIELCPCPV